MVKLSLFITLTLLSLISVSQSVQVEWSVVDSKTNKLIELEGGSIQYNLFKQNILPSPFTNSNEKEYDYIENQKWKLNSSFTVDSAFLSKNEISFSCAGIDTYAKIYLNDVLVYEADNAFINHRFDIKEALHLGKNEFKAVFTPPKLFHSARASEGFQYPMPNDIDSVKVASYSRKPQYQFGWDWTGRMNTIGFTSPVIIEATNHVTAKNWNVQTLLLDDSDAWLQLNIDFNSLGVETVTWKSRLLGEERLFVTNNKIERISRLKDVELWWPVGHGKQHMYSDTWEIFDDNGNLLFSKDIRFGVKTSSLKQAKDQFGTSYEIEVNGEVIFAKGANYIPPSVFPVEITDEKIESVLQNAVDANFNMLRVWGGGIYSSDYFMKRCDELGIMVWHDFMFACAMYPANGDFVESVTKELE